MQDLPSNPDIRHDLGGWISGPSMSEPPPPHVPPGSTPLREMAHAVAIALTLPNPATTRDELTYLRIMRDLMLVVASLRDQAASLGDDAYDHAPDPS